MVGSILGSHPLFNTKPSSLSGEPSELNSTIAQSALFYERFLNETQSQSNIYVKARLALCYRQLGAIGSASDLALEIQAELAELEIYDETFDDLARQWETTLEEDALNAAMTDASGIMQYSQRWKSTKGHHFPFHISSNLPIGHEVLKDRWRLTYSRGSESFRKFLTAHAIETNHIESAFLMTENSTRDLIRYGIDAGAVDAHYSSEIKDSGVIKSILNDTLAAYEIIEGIVDGSTDLTPLEIMKIHSRLMATARFTGTNYVPPGDTRSTTKKTVVVGPPSSPIQCCPYLSVNGELLVICQESAAKMKKKWNPFAVASWLHLILARCHPFDDGNGRVTRLVASIPLLRAGYPPIVISLKQRDAYFEGINQAYHGNHLPMIQCIFDGMKDAMERIERISETEN